MERIPVSSTNIKSVGYSADAQEIEVEFTSGSVYRYLQVDAKTFDALMMAESKGKFFGENIKPNFDFIKIAGQGGKEIPVEEQKEVKVVNE